MTTFESAMEQLLADESGKVIENDHGRGPSHWGITLETAQQFNTEVTAADIINMTKEQAAAWYKVTFWDHNRYGEIQFVPLATKVFNEAVNLGAGTANKILQKFAGVTEDGVIGQKTLDAVNGDDCLVLLNEFKLGCIERHDWLAENYPELTGNLKGWLHRDLE